MKRIALFPGTFDPITIGHINLIERAMHLYDEIVIGIGHNSTKSTLFSLEQRENWIKDIFKNHNKAYEAMSKAIASFETTKEFAPFDSKYDRYLRGEYEMTQKEELGKALFFSNNNTNCAVCHILKGEDKEGETFTNYEYHNIGVPSNKVLFEKGVVKVGFKDIGLAKNPKAKSKENEGKFKVPTLRNIAITAPYMHNGVFKDFRTVIAFYDKFNNPSRVNNPETNQPWEEAEVQHTINHKDLKMKKLSEEKIDALVAFLKTLTDKRYETP
jgi:cytidyltransferase-like protein